MHMVMYILLSIFPIGNSEFEAGYTRILTDIYPSFTTLASQAKSEFRTSLTKTRKRAVFSWMLQFSPWPILYWSYRGREKRCHDISGIYPPPSTSGK